jgi:hypothetical protein
MDWKWTDHIEMQLLERKISKESVETAINNPDQVIDGKRKRKPHYRISYR